MDKISLLIADDHQMFRTAITALLNKKEGIEVVGEARGGKEVIQMDEDLRPDLILMDIDLPGIDGIEATKAILKKRPKARVLAVTSYEEEDYVLNMIRAGAKGYILKEAPIDELVLAVRTLANGSSYFAKEVSAKLLDLLRQSNVQVVPKKAITQLSLTGREIEVLGHIAAEMTNKEIAAKLFISPRTVETHRRNLINKLKVKNTAGLVKFYLNYLHGPGKGALVSSDN